MASVMHSTNQEVLTSISKDDKLPILANLLKSVGRISKGDSSGTIFIASVQDKGKKHLVFFSAGHIFAENGVLPQDINFAEYKLEFGNQPSFTLQNIVDIFSTTTVIMFRTASLVKERDFVLPEPNFLPYMDTFAMILHDNGDAGAVERLLRSALQLEPLQCGDGLYLEPKPGVSIFLLGYPGVGLQKSVESLRFSIGREFGSAEITQKLEDHLRNLKSSSTFTGICQTKCDHEKNCKFCQLTSRIDQLKTPEFCQNRIFYTNDTLPGNSGSPILSSGDNNTSDMAYSVKGIHVEGVFQGEANAAQSLMGVLSFVKSYF